VIGKNVQETVLA